MKNVLAVVGCVVLLALGVGGLFWFLDGANILRDYDVEVPGDPPGVQGQVHAHQEAVWKRWVAFAEKNCVRQQVGNEKLMYCNDGHAYRAQWRHPGSLRKDNLFLPANMDQLLQEDYTKVDLSKRQKEDSLPIEEMQVKKIEDDGRTLWVTGVPWIPASDRQWRANELLDQWQEFQKDHCRSIPLPEPRRAIDGRVLEDHRSRWVACDDGQAYRIPENQAFGPGRLGDRTYRPPPLFVWSQDGRVGALPYGFVSLREGKYPPRFVSDEVVEKLKVLADKQGLPAYRLKRDPDREVLDAEVRSMVGLPWWEPEASVIRLEKDAP